MTNKISLPPVITEDSLQNFVKTWFKDLLYHEIIAVTGYPQSNTRMIFLEIIGNRKLLSDNDINPDDYLFISLDFNVDHIDEAIDMEKFIIQKLRQYHVYNSEDEPDFLSVIKSLKCQIVISAFGCERIIERNKTNLLQWISTISNYTPIKTLLFFENNIFTARSRRFFTEISDFHPHIFFYKLFQEKDCIQYADHLCAKWNLTIPDDKKSKITSLSGGQLSILKEIIRYISQNPDGDVSKVFSSLDLQFFLSTFYNSFHSEKNLLNEIVLKADIIEIENHESYRYFSEIGLIKKGKGRIELTIPLFKDFIVQELSNRKKLIVINDHIYVNDIPVSVNFSKREQKILIQMIDKPKKIFSREEIARILWPKTEAGNYSDWALDSHISRIRQKLIAVGLPKTILATKKGQGVYLNR